MQQFPVFKTKTEGITQKFNLNDPTERKAYFELKAGAEIKKLRNFLKDNSFIVYLLGKKNSGKGTYSKMFAEIVDFEKIDHFSIGDVIREIDKELKVPEKRKELINFLEKNYRGFLSLEELVSNLEKRSTEKLLPTEIILTLFKREISKRKKKALFVDGFPRDLDQISYSLFFRDLIGYREDQDIFVLIDVSEKVIDERIKWRRICPLCQTSRNLKLLPTSKINYDKKEKQFYLICDNPLCKEVRMIQKEGDAAGIKSIQKRLEMDEKLIEKAFSLYGIPRILLRNTVPVEKAEEYVDDYEITPEYSYEQDEKTKNIKIIEKPWQVLNDEGVPSYSLLPPPIVVSLIKQMVAVLHL